MLDIPANLKWQRMSKFPGNVINSPVYELATTGGVRRLGRVKDGFIEIHHA